MTPQEFYLNILSGHTALLKKASRKRNFLTAAKLTTFAAIVFCIYRIVTGEPAAWIATGIGMVVAFVILTIWDNRVAERIIRLKTLIRCCHTETNYLSGEVSELPTGNEYLDPAHPYALDLDLFGQQSLFQAVNRTVTPGGSDLLAQWLLQPCLEGERIVRRQEAAAELADTPEWCLDFRTSGIIRGIESSETTVIARWLAEPPFFGRRSARKILYGANGIVLLLWVAAFCSLIPYPIAWAGFAINLAILSHYLKRLNKLSRALDRFSKAIGAYHQLIGMVDREKFTSSEMRRLQQTLQGERSAAKAFGSLDRILSAFDQRNNVLVEICLNGLYLKDLHHVLQLDRWRETYRSQVTAWIDTVSRTDALVSTATYRFNHPDYCIPEISDRVMFEADAMGHPLLAADGRVCNDFSVGEIHDLYIVTGANMAGKSTFLRTVGVNLVLALSGNVTCCRSFSFRPMALFTSMRTTDNLAKGTSYFHAELLRLQQLVETAAHEERMFIILDEMLKGTNSQDKLNGSLKFLTRLLSLPVAGLIATHDLALGELAAESPEHFRNVCFEIEHSGDQIHYDYKLREGVSRNMNASILLRQMGLI